MHPVSLTLAALVASTPLAAETLEIFSLAELDEAAGRSGLTVTMEAGTYRLTEFLPLESMKARRERGEFPYLTFSGSDNTFNLDGVTIEVDTALRNALKPPVHSDEFLVTGDRNIFRGLTITTIGDGTSPGGGLLALRGKNNTLRDCLFYVGGSFPYGYGDLFGKGGPGVIGHRKHSGVLITGDGSRLFGCRLFMRSFGHGYYVQQDAADVSFEDCYVEGVMRPTDEMLAENSGPAFDVGFRTVLKNRAGEHRVTAGYMKSLAEDGFRTYGEHRNLIFKNCIAKNMRAGFELRTKSGPRLENCTAIGNERGFWLSSGAVARDCRGDARFGPLLFLEGDRAEIDLTLLPETSDRTVHALATIRGSGHSVTLRPAVGPPRENPLPVMLAHGAPPAGEGMSPYSEFPANDITLINHTTMPVVIGARTEDCRVATRGEITANHGRAITIKKLEP